MMKAQSAEEQQQQSLFLFDRVLLKLQKLWEQDIVKKSTQFMSMVKKVEISSSPL
jgi:hypothetical protein